jgi:hypothetical protein
METLNNIIWLASYPKSGNTWFRSFLTALKSEHEAFNINELKTDGIFSGKEQLENVLDIDADYLQQSEIEQFQRVAWNYTAAQSKTKKFVKIHDAFTCIDDAQSTTLIPEEATYKAVYFVRHPYDVVPSLANHNGKDIESTVAFFNDPDAAFINVKKKKSFAANQFYQHLGTWNEHVKSWLERPSFPVHFMRYEDMKMSPFETFKKAIEFMELDYSDAQINEALEMTKFENLRKQEEEKGFREKSTKTKFFFNKGEMNYGKSLLTEKQIESIKQVNEEMMKHFGYWQ